MIIMPLKYGNTNTFFVKDSGAGLLVDTDWPGTLPLLYREIKEKGVALDDIQYVLATHYHPDHMGLVSELMDLGVKLIVMDVQKNHIHDSDDILRRGKHRGYRPIQEASAVFVPCGESRMFLGRLGIKGEIFHTPGHSDDSVSLILDDGFAMVGDLPPLELSEAYGDNRQLKESWKQILACGVQTICYSHSAGQTLSR